MAKKIKILQISPRSPFPADDGGRIGIANIFIQYTKQAEKVSFLFLSEKNEKLSEINKYNDIANIIRLPFEPKYTAFKILKSIFSTEPLYISKHIEKKLISYILNFIGKIDFDVVHIDHTYLAPLGIAIRNATGKPFAIRIHNIESNIWKRYTLRFPIYHPLRYYFSRQSELLLRKELEFIEQADVNFAITQNELDEIRSNAPEAKIIIAGAGINPNDWTIDNKIKRNQYEAILATTYKWIHNIEAVKWLIQKVMPIVKKELPEASLTLIGKSPPSWLRSYSNLGVNVIGYVPKVQTYLNRAALYVAPLFVGAGVRIKILEAMAMGLPVVATSISADGINASQENGIFIADDHHTFAEIIIYLMKNPDISELSGNKARSFVFQHYSWEKSVKLMIDEFEKLINK